MEFVVLGNSSANAPVDNNRQRNYTLSLSGALTEEQILQKRTDAVAAFERRHMQVGSVAVPICFYAAIACCQRGISQINSAASRSTRSFMHMAFIFLIDVRCARGQ